MNEALERTLLAFFNREDLDPRQVASMVDLSESDVRSILEFRETLPDGRFDRGVELTLARGIGPGKLARLVAATRLGAFGEVVQDDDEKAVIERLPERAKALLTPYVAAALGSQALGRPLDDRERAIADQLGESFASRYPDLQRVVASLAESPTALAGADASLRDRIERFEEVSSQQLVDSAEPTFELTRMDGMVLRRYVQVVKDEDGGMEKITVPRFFHRIPTDGSSPIIAVISDTHIGGKLSVNDFEVADRAELLRAVSWLQRLASLKNAKVILVLAGDILEFWETPPFLDAKTATRDKRTAAVGKVADIQVLQQTANTTTRGVFERLRGFASSNQVFYLFGNHDDDARDAGVQRRIKELLGDVTFLDRYPNREFKLVVTHGHQYDDQNYAEGFGEQVLGRQLTESFAAAAEVITNVVKERPFRDIDAFRPPAGFADYVRCIAKDPDGRPSAVDAGAVERFRQLVKRLVANPDLELGPGLRIARSVLSLFITDELELFEQANSFGKSNPDDYDAKSLLAEYPGFKCAIMGHTHDEKIVDLGRGRKYINSGAWMDKVKANKDDPCNPIPLPTRHLTLLYREAINPRLVAEDDGTMRQANSTPTSTVHYEMFYFPGISTRPEFADQGIKYLTGPLPRFPNGVYLV